MKIVLAFISALVASSLSLSALGNWHDPNGDRFGGIKGIDLGTIRISFENRRGVYPDTIYISRPEIPCNLTHLKLQAINASVRIHAVEVEYFGTKSKGLLILNDNDDYRRWFRGPSDGRTSEDSGGQVGWGNNHLDSRRTDRGIVLNPGESTPIFDLYDVRDKFKDGFCVNTIRVISADDPNAGGEVGHGPRDPGYGSEMYNTLANIQIQGFPTYSGRRPGDSGYRPNVKGLQF